MSSPYQPSSFDSQQFQDQPAIPPGTTAGSSNWVKQVRIFAVFNAIQGALEIMGGFVATASGLFFPFLAQMEEFKEAQAKEDMPTEEMLWVIGITYVVIGLVLLASGILRIVAGFQNYRFKGRVLGIVSIVLGIAVVFTGVCAPTAIALLVLGLLIFVDPDVIAAFQMARTGRSVSQILAAFDPQQTALPTKPG